jgi:hypothetical protein
MSSPIVVSLLLLAQVQTSTAYQATMERMCTESLPDVDMTCFDPPNTCTMLENRLFLAGACYRWRLDLKKEECKQCQDDLKDERSISSMLAAQSTPVEDSTNLLTWVGVIAIAAAVGAVAGGTVVYFGTH